MKDRAEPVLVFSTVQDMQAHFARQPKGAKGFWLKLSKAGAPKATISKADAIEAALCFGRIDGQLAKYDDHHFLVRMTPVGQTAAALRKTGQPPSGSRASAAFHRPGWPKSKRQKRTDDGTPPTHHRQRRRYRPTWPRLWP